jgi:hypothetical protein
MCSKSNPFVVANSCFNQHINTTIPDRKYFRTMNVIGAAEFGEAAYCQPTWNVARIL